jgi:hypothetical protein
MDKINNKKDTPLRLPLVLPEKMEVDRVLFQKMMFIYNALDDGWSIKKIEDSYVFIKKHEGKKEIFQDNYLTNFILSNMDIDKLPSSF